MVVFVSSFVFIITFCVLFYIIYINKQKKHAKIQKINSIDKNYINSLEDRIKKQITDIDLGVFGKFLTNNIDIHSMILKMNRKGFSKEKQPEIALEIIEGWKYLIESNYQYIINCFMSYPLMGVELDECWDDWCFSEEQKKLSKEELDILRKQREKQIQSELKKYSDKENPKDIAALYKKCLPYFNYNDFIKTINLEYLTLDLDNITIQLSDKNHDLFCAAYLVFDKDLDNYDWHNF